MDAGETRRGTSAHMPDLNWSQVRETVLMLELSAAQIEGAMRDSNASVEVLTASFTSMADYMRSITETISALPDAGGAGDAREALLGSAGQVSGMVHQAIIAFQFYDKLAQRLDHVCHSLAGLSLLVSDRQRLYSPGEWKVLQEEILAKYTMIEERAMFEAVLNGATVREALDAYMSQRMAKVERSGGDIELF